MELSHRPELRHKVTLSPQVYQGLSILAMPIVDLQQLIEVEMLENPVLEVDESESEPLEGEESSDEREDDERSWDEWLEMYEDLDSMEPTAPRDPNAETANTEDFVGGVQTFDDYLLNQLALLDISDDVARAGRAVIGSLDADGFFVGSLDEIAALTGVSRRAAEQGLEAVQQLDPPGVGARDLTEALCSADGVPGARRAASVSDHTRATSTMWPRTTIARSRGRSKSTRTRSGVSWTCCAP